MRRIDQRRQVVIPKKIFDALAVEKGLVEVTAENGRVAMTPRKHVDADDMLTIGEAKKVRHALKQLKAGKTQPWPQIKRELDL
ncbi:MAG: AbrB/MazE/SpoVT family DNA-binding domain-containing protein [Bryobacteraceae bacterium]